MTTKHEFLTSAFIVTALTIVMFVNSASNAGALAVPPQIGDEAGTMGIAVSGAIFGTAFVTGNAGQWVRMAASSSTKTRSGPSSGGTSQGGSKPPMRPGDYPVPSGSTATAATAGSPGPTGATGGSLDLPK